MAELSNEWGKEVCKQLGLDPGIVMDITVKSIPNRPLTIEVTLAPGVDDIRMSLESLYNGRIEFWQDDELLAEVAAIAEETD